MPRSPHSDLLNLGDLLSGGVATLIVDGTPVAQSRIDKTLSSRISLDEGFDVGMVRARVALFADTFYGCHAHLGFVLSPCPGYRQRRRA